MSAQNVNDFLAYWLAEGERYARHGDYDWMASLAGGERVLEIGCGVGFGTAALIRRGAQVLAVDSLPLCLETTRERVPAADLQLLEADVAELAPSARQAIEAFAPDTVVCWLMGAPGEVTGAQGPAASQAVAAYRDRIQRAVAELAAELPTVRALHFVDRTAIPWQAKDIGRETLVRYHTAKILVGLPFVAERQRAMYRKLAENPGELSRLRQVHPSLRGVVPTLASLVAERKT